MNKHHTLRLVFRSLAILGLVSGAYIANAGTPERDSKGHSLSIALLESSFESQWQAIDQYINSHAISNSSETKSQIKAETKAGVHSWVCIGPGLGFPVNYGMLVFDSSENAGICAQLILSLAESQSEYVAQRRTSLLFFPQNWLTMG